MYAAALLSDEADLAYASATDVAAAIRARRVSPVEAVLAFRTNRSVPAWLGT